MGYWVGDGVRPKNFYRLDVALPYLKKEGYWGEGFGVDGICPRCEKRMLVLGNNPVRCECGWEWKEE